MAKINVGAATESEMKEKKARVEDALHATRAAVEEGILPGGGVALLRAVDLGQAQGPDPRRGDRLQDHRPRLPAPLDQIAENAGQDGGVVVSKVAEGKGNFGYNALTDEYTDLVKAGIIDPTKVTRYGPAERRQRQHAAADQRRPDRRHAQGRQTSNGPAGHGV